MSCDEEESQFQVDSLIVLAWMNIMSIVNSEYTSAALKVDEFMSEVEKTMDLRKYYQKIACSKHEPIFTFEVTGPNFQYGCVDEKCKSRFLEKVRDTQWQRVNERLTAFEEDYRTRVRNYVEQIPMIGYIAEYTITFNCLELNEPEEMWRFDYKEYKNVPVRVLVKKFLDPKCFHFATPLKAYDFDSADEEEDEYDRWKAKEDDEENDEVEEGEDEEVLENEEDEEVQENEEEKEEAENKEEKKEENETQAEDEEKQNKEKEIIEENKHKYEEKEESRKNDEGEI